MGPAHIFFLLPGITFTLQLNPYVRGFTFIDLLNMQWSQVYPLLPPGTCLHLLRAYGSAFPLTLHIISILADHRRILLAHAFALLSTRQFLRKKTTPRVRVCYREDSNPRLEI